MIEFGIKTNPDFLRQLAADARANGHTATAQDLDVAAHDLKELREHAERLERSLESTSSLNSSLTSEINSLRTQRDETASALLAVFRPELEKMVNNVMDEWCRPLELLRERLEELLDEDTRDDDKAEDICREVRDMIAEDIRREVRDMIADGEIIVSLDVS
jgi:predicted  nucleic acid-binding Zn-ribbon protein